jgi:hypothetical protein
MRRLIEVAHRSKPSLLPPIPGVRTPRKWMNFYTRVQSRFALGHTLKLLFHVDVSQPAGISAQKIEETKSALRELGLDDEIYKS